MNDYDVTWPWREFSWCCCLPDFLPVPRTSTACWNSPMWYIEHCHCHYWPHATLFGVTWHDSTLLNFSFVKKLHPNPSGKKNKNKVMNECWEKPQKCRCLSKVLAFFSKPERTSWSLIPQLDIVIIEVSSVKGLSLRGNPLQLYRAKHLPLMNWTYGDTGFYNGQTSYLNMKVFAEDENMRFF